MLKLSSILRSASFLAKIISQAVDSDKDTVFLGGSCEDNKWRENLKKQFSDRFFFIDPYDPDWDAKDNIYDELAGLSIANHVVFYKGGDGSEKEKAFLKIIGKDFKEFEGLEKLKKYLSGRKKCAGIRTLKSKTGGVSHEIEQRARETIKEFLSGKRFQHWELEDSMAKESDTIRNAGSLKDFKTYYMQKAIQKAMNNSSVYPEDIEPNRYFIAVLDRHGEYLHSMSTLSKQTALEEVNYFKKMQDARRIVIERPKRGVKQWVKADNGEWVSEKAQLLASYTCSERIVRAFMAENAHVTAWVVPHTHKFCEDLITRDLQ